MTHSKAVIIVLFGGLCISFAALFVRLIDTADGFQILAYRGIGQFLVITLAACLIRRVTPTQFFTSVFTSLGGCGLWMGLAMGLSYCFYVFALLNTSVASTLFIQSSAPIFTALLSWIFLGEKPAKRTVIAIGGAVLGVGIMVWSGADLGRGLGNFYAILAAFFFAVMLVISRGSGRSDVLGGNLLGAVFASIWMVGAALVFSKGGLAVSGYDFVIMFLMGFATIGLGVAMLSWASPRLPAAEVSVLALTESLLSPMWVWIFIGEALSWLEMLGGAVLLASVVLLVWRGKSRAAV
ncbi:MAG: DMT family transporter [Candidatus Halichondribacter symbioticus]